MFKKGEAVFVNKRHGREIEPGVGIVTKVQKVGDEKDRDAELRDINITVAYVTVEGMASISDFLAREVTRAIPQPAISKAEVEKQIVKTEVQKQTTDPTKVEVKK